MKQYKSFLLECIQFLVENRVKTLKEQNPELTDAIDRYADADNSKTKKFVPWLVSQHKKGNVTPDHPDLESTVRNFDRYKARHGITDHSKHDFQFVAGKVGEHLGKAATRKEQELEQKIDGVEKIHHGEDGIEAFHIKTKEASQLLYGGGEQRGPDDPSKPHGFRGTSWCTAARSENCLFEKLYGKKYTVHIPDDPRSPYAVHPGMKTVTSRFNDGDKDYDNMLLPEKIRPILDKIDNHHFENSSEREKSIRRFDDKQETEQDIDTLLDTHSGDVDDGSTGRIYDSKHFKEAHADKIVDGIMSGKFSEGHIHSLLGSGKLSKKKSEEFFDFAIQKYKSKERDMGEHVSKQLLIGNFVRSDKNHIDNMTKLKKHGINLHDNVGFTTFSFLFHSAIRSSEGTANEKNEAYGHLIDSLNSEKEFDPEKRQNQFSQMVAGGELDEDNIRKVAKHTIDNSLDVEKFHDTLHSHENNSRTKLSDQFLLDHYNDLSNRQKTRHDRMNMLGLGESNSPHKEQFLKDHLHEITDYELPKVINHFKTIPSSFRKGILDKSINLLGLGPYHTGGVNMAEIVKNHAHHLDSEQIHNVIKNTDPSVFGGKAYSNLVFSVTKSPAFTEEHANAARSSSRKDAKLFATHSKFGTFDEALKYKSSDASLYSDDIEDLEKTSNPHMVKAMVLDHGNTANMYSSVFHNATTHEKFLNMTSSDIDEIIDKVKRNPGQYKQNGKENTMSEIHRAKGFTAEHAKRILSKPELHDTRLFSSDIVDKLTSDEDITALAAGRYGSSHSVSALWHPNAKHHHIDTWLERAPFDNERKSRVMKQIKKINDDHPTLKDYDYDGKIAQLTSDVNT